LNIASLKMEMKIMPKHLISIIKISLVVFLVGLLTAYLTATSGWGADQSVAPATITLDVTNEPLGSVLGKITKTTKWKINVPDKWLDRPVTQSLNKATLEEGLRSVLNNAGVANLFLMYDENIKVVAVFDTETAQSLTAARTPAPATAQRPVAAAPAAPATAPAAPDPRLQAPVSDTPPRSSRGARVRGRQGSHDD
jgi:hypothetical protein